METKILGTVIGLGTTFEGTLTSNHSIRVEGTLKGQVIINGDLFLEKSGIIDAHVEVNKAKIAGNVSGLLIAKEQIELQESAVVVVDIQTQDLVLHEGAIFKGNNNSVKS